MLFSILKGFFRIVTLKELAVRLSWSLRWTYGLWSTDFWLENAIWSGIGIIPTTIQLTPREIRLGTSRELWRWIFRSSKFTWRTQPKPRLDIEDSRSWITRKPWRLLLCFEIIYRIIRVIYREKILTLRNFLSLENFSNLISFRFWKFLSVKNCQHWSQVYGWTQVKKF